MTLACRPGLGEFFLKNGLVDRVIEVDKRSGKGRSLALGKIRGEEWDIVFVPHESLRTTLWMLRVKARRGKIGFRKWWNFGIYKYRVVKPMDFPDALRQLSLLTPLDGTLAEYFGSYETHALASPLSQESPFDFEEPPIPQWASMTLAQNKPVGRRIFLAPGSVWATKRWTVQGYTELAKKLLHQGFTVELVGSGQEKPLCDVIAREVKGVINRAGQTSLSGLVDLFAEGTALICNDSGAMHAAAAAGLPTVAIFGPTVLSLGFRPWQNRAVVVQRELKCRPCGKHGAKECPIGTHECMTGISTNDVMAALDELTVGTL